MNGEQIYDALEYVGHDLIISAEKQRFPTPIWRPVVSAAAVIAVLFGIGTVSLWRQSVPADETKQAPMKYSVAQMYQDADEPEAAIEEEVVQETDLAQATAEGQHQGAMMDTEQIDGMLYTTQGDRVLTVDIPNGIILISIEGENYGGVLAVVTEPERISLQPSSQLGETGEEIGTVAEDYGAVLAVNASLVLDVADGSADGGAIAGYAMCEGVEYNADAHLGEGYVRAEFDENGILSLKEAAQPIAPSTRNAVEAGPALIENGEIMVGSTSMVAPRTCLGQDKNGTTYLLVMEGRIPDGSQGVTWLECAEILKRYGCINAVNLDGGTSSILWYKGEYLTKCSNPMLPNGRLCPTALVVKKK